MNHKPITAALSDTDTNRRLIAAAQGHKPGRVITHPDGTRYQVTPSGAWLRLTSRRHESTK